MSENNRSGESKPKNRISKMRVGVLADEAFRIHHFDANGKTLGMVQVQVVTSGFNQKKRRETHRAMKDLLQGVGVALRERMLKALDQSSSGGNEGGAA